MKQEMFLINHPCDSTVDSSLIQCGWNQNEVLGGRYELAIHG